MVRCCCRFARVVSLLIGSLGAATAAGAQDISASPFTFGLFCDLAYSAAEEPLMANVLSDLNRMPFAFVAHVGDLGSPRAGSCTEELWARRLAQFEASENPLVYTPGDNDWTDCHDQEGVFDADPLERLAKLRSFFFASGHSFGRRSIPLMRQSDNPQYAKYRENARWDLGGITFLTLHVVGSNNGLGRTSAGDVEFADRTNADLAWLHDGLAHAQAENSRAAMIIQHFSEFLPVSRKSQTEARRVCGAPCDICQRGHGFRQACRPGAWRQPLFSDRQAIHAQASGFRGSRN